MQLSLIETLISNNLIHSRSSRRRKMSESFWANLTRVCTSAMSFFSFLIFFRFLSFGNIVHIALNIVYFNFGEGGSKNLPCFPREQSLFTETLKISWSTPTEIEANFICGYREKEKSKKDKKRKKSLWVEKIWMPCNQRCGPISTLKDQIYNLGS